MEKTLEYAGIKNYTGKVHYNLCPAKLVEYALKRKEGLLTDQGALVVKQENILVVHHMINLL